MEHAVIDATPLISHNTASCTECWGCVRCCPVKAIRVVGSRSEVVQEKCVACGICVAECGRKGHVVRDDTPAVREMLRSRRPVVVLLASEFAAALHPLTVAQIERGLEALGFWGIETTLLGEEIVAAAYRNVHLREDMLLSIRSTCPVAVNFVRAFHPALVPALAPIMPPYVAQARLIREVYAQEHAIVYVSPCYARKDEIADPQFGGVIDAAIDFTELRRMLETAEDAPARGRVIQPRAVRPGVWKELSLTDGFPRHTLESRDQTDRSVATVRGIAGIDRLLRAVAAGEAGPTIIDMLNCESCIDGPAVSPGLSLFAKRNIESAARERPGATHVNTRAMLSVLPSVDIVRSFRPRPVRVRQPAPAEIDEVLAAGRLTRESALDCGACGWSTCVEHAAAIFRAESSWELCLPLQRLLAGEQTARAEACRSELEETRTLEPVTGLWNRRVFAERLDVELARHHRYELPLTVALVDVDGLGALNDEITRDGGDAVLAGIARRFTRSLRATDFAARWSGDQFAIILPGIDKTAAFAVGEKLRQAVSGTPLSVAADGYTRDVTVTVSIGIAAASPARAEAHELIEAADEALRQAMDAGRDRVELAPG